MTISIDQEILLALMLFALKLLDCTFNTFKTIYMNKDKYALSALWNTVSNVLYLVAIVQIAKSPNFWYGVIAVAVATFFGTWAPAAWVKRREPDQLMVYEITSDTMDNGKQFADVMAANNIPYNVKKTYVKRKKTLVIKVFSESRKESYLIESRMLPGFKGIRYRPEATINKEENAPLENIKTEVKS